MLYFAHWYKLIVNSTLATASNEVKKHKQLQFSFQNAFEYVVGDNIFYSLKGEKVYYPR